uniref:Uncharacterized protein n=1 Tax=Tetradesmus obliquus TaxID=3088 RepID=A0A383V4U6_TETOB|eukprot:jgi/Sobl393_1/1329/SZX59802.1
MWACGKLRVHDAAFLERAAAAARSWLLKAGAPNVRQVAYACRELQFKDEKLVAGLVNCAQQVQQRGQQQTLAMTAEVGCAVAELDMQQLAGNVKSLVASSGATAGTQLRPVDTRMLWQVHAWLLQHQLLDGQGLAGLLSQQQLEQGRAAAEAYHQEQQQ